MAHHKSTRKRIKTNRKANIRNRQFRASMRTALRRVRESESNDDRLTNLHQACAILDRLATKKIIHRNTAARRKSRLHRFVALAENQ
ncbi:MAG: 30S ribosomal protein S20 [Candidatus Electryoneaceae bacterium]|nr:30S ribosomal protein S20 [Candidatus Electryoneaceae bacterium]